jgi:hypothetical protein
MTEGIGQDSVTTITIDNAFFEHLLNCMCNQKYLPTLDRPVSEREKKDQDIIDTAYHKARDLQSQNKRSSMPVDIDPDTAITAFMGWLTSRDEVVGPFSSRHDPSVDLIKQFCEAQGWHASNERFHQQIKLLKMHYPSE